MEELFKFVLICAPTVRNSRPTGQPGGRTISPFSGCKKLNPRYVGPYKITRTINEHTYELALHSRVHPKFHVSLLKPTVLGSLATHSSAESPPTPLEVDGQLAYWVRNILNSCWRAGRLEYLVDWEGYGPEEQCWVPRHDILDLTPLSISNTNTNSHHNLGRDLGEL